MAGRLCPLPEAEPDPSWAHFVSPKSPGQPLGLAKRSRALLWPLLCPAGGEGRAGTLWRLRGHGRRREPSITSGEERGVLTHGLVI